MENTENLAVSRGAALDGASLPFTAETDEVLAVLRKYGIAILPRYFSGKTLAALNEEFDIMLERATALDFNVIERDEAKTVAIIRNRLPATDFPSIAETFGLPFMADISRAYYGGAKIALNHQIYANLNRGTAEAVPDLPFVPHLDKIRTLKFFVYLTDTEEQNGAMGVVPGSQVANAAHRLECLRSNPDYRTVTNVIAEAKTIPVEGPAGTLFIFDTDVTHSAGHVRPGKERRILRGHTRTIPELESLRLHQQAVGIEV